MKNQNYQEGEFDEAYEEEEVDEYIQADDSPHLQLQKIIEMTGWTQQKMAELLCVTQPQISQYLKGKSRMSYHIEDRIYGIYSRVKGGLKINAFSSSGTGHATLEKLSTGVVSNAVELSEREMQGVRKATLYLDPINGGSLAKAEEILKDAGFEIFYE